MDLKTELLRLIQKTVSDANYDKTSKAVIVEVPGAGQNMYKVKLNGAVYSAPSLTSNTYQKGEKVWVLLPQNQIKDIAISGRRL